MPWLTYQALGHTAQDRPNTGGPAHFQLLSIAACCTAWVRQKVFCLKLEVPTEMGFLFPWRRAKQSGLNLGGVKA